MPAFNPPCASHRFVLGPLALLLVVTQAFLCAHAFLSPVATGGQWYVATTGNDANPGTQSQPWRTIQKAATTITPGDTCTVLAGDYPERVTVTHSGTSGSPVTFRAEGTVAMRGFTIKANYVSVIGFDISSTPDSGQDGYGIFAQGHHNVITGNYVHYCTRGGIVLYATPSDPTVTRDCVVNYNRLDRNAMVGIEVHGTNNLIEGNNISGTIQHHPSWRNHPSWVDADGIRFFGTGHTLRGNYIHDIRYGVSENINPHIDCFQTWADSLHQAATNITIEQNWCDNCQVQNEYEVGQGFMLDGASGVVIRNNIIRAFRHVNAVGSSDLKVLHNVFASSLSFSQHYQYSVGLASSPNAMVKNNIFLDNRRYYLSPANLTTTGLDAGYNCVYRTDGQQPVGTPYPHDLWGVNPRFVNVAAGDYHLTFGSPCIDKGAALASVTNDFGGRSRPQSSGYDIGAYEYLPPRTLAGLSWQADAGIIDAPFVANGGQVSQPYRTDDAIHGGRAEYRFRVDSAATFEVWMLVDAPTGGSSSFLVGIDSEPPYPTAAFCIPVTQGPEQRTVSWQGNGTPTQSQYVPKVFNLGAREHTLIIRGLGANVPFYQVGLRACGGPLDPRYKLVMPLILRE